MKEKIDIGAKIAQYLLVILVVITLNFLLPRLMPGDPLAYLTGDPGIDLPMVMSEQVRGKLLSYYGLDKPFIEQYADYIVNLVQGNLGWSIYYNTPVSAILVGHLKWTLLLVGSATIIYSLLGILLGVISAWKRETKLDAGLLSSLLSLGSWPPFFLAMLLIIFFGVKLKFFPISGAKMIVGAYPSLSGYIGDILRHLALPAITLVLTHLAGIYLLMRNSMLSVLGEDYILAARAKGLRERDIMFRHAMRNALLPIITKMALSLGFLMMGAIFVETVFAYPGMGSLIYEAATTRDYPVLQGAFLFIALLLIFANFMADMVYVRLDPRVSKG